MATEPNIISPSMLTSDAGLVYCARKSASQSTPRNMAMFYYHWLTQHCLLIFGSMTERADSILKLQLSISQLSTQGLPDKVHKYCYILFLPYIQRAHTTMTTPLHL